MELIELLNVTYPSGYVTIKDDNEIKKFPGEIQGTAQNLLYTLEHKILHMDVDSIRQDTRCNTFPVLHVHLKED